MTTMQSMLQSIVSTSPIPWSLVLAFLKASLVLGVAQIVVIALPRLSAAAKHLILVSGLSGFLLVPLFAGVLPAWNVAVLPASPPATPSMIEPATLRPDGTLRPDPVQFVSDRGISDAASATPLQVSARAVPPAAESSSPDWWSIVAWAWTTVALLLFLRLLLGILRVSWILRIADEPATTTIALAEGARAQLGITSTVRIAVSDRAHVPMIWGLFRPALLLPAEAETWDDDQLRAVLLHELGHLQRSDALTLLLGNAVTSLFWFHPQVWIADLRARRECERACDDLVLLSGTKPSDYAGHLLSVVRVMPAIERFGSITLAMSHPSQLEGRLLAILHPHLSRTSLSRRSKLTAAAFTLALIAPLASVRLTASPAESAPELLTGGPVSETIVVEPERGEIELASNRSKHDTWDENEGPHTGEEWMKRGYDLHHSDRHDEAIAAFEKAIELGYRPASAMYNIACAHALRNDKENALRWLERAIEAGFSRQDHLLKDSDLDPLRSDPRFKALVERALERSSDRSKTTQRTRDRHAEALETYRQLRDGGGAEASEWGNIGYRLLSVRELDAAVDALGRAVRQSPRTRDLYNLACAHALRGDTRSAMQALRQTVELGFSRIDKLENDPDLASLRSDRELAMLVRFAEDLSLHRPDLSWSSKNPGEEKQRWAAVAQHFEAMVRKYPNAGLAWFHLGFSLHSAGSHERAIDAFHHAARLGYRPGTSLYNVACALSRLNRKDEAFAALRDAADAGFDVDGHMLRDEDLMSIRSDARFDPYRERIELKRRIERERKLEEKREREILKKRERKRSDRAALTDALADFV